MTNRLAKLMLVAVIAILVIAACSSDSEDVPSLRTTGDRQLGEPTADAVDSVRDAEAAMMALTECLREQGIEVYDPVVDAEGNVGKSELVEGVDEKEAVYTSRWKFQGCRKRLKIPANTASSPFGSGLFEPDLSPLC